MDSTTTTGKEEEEIVLLVLQQHPSHDHPLQLLDSTNHSSIAPICRLCHRKISSTTAEAYTCKKRCKANLYYHRLCVEAPSQIDLHPLHLEHPLILRHNQKKFYCDACFQSFQQGSSSFICQECGFDLDIACALSTLSDEGVYQCGKTPEQITIPSHPHPLTSFTKRHEFVVERDCYICEGSVEEDGYMCLQCPCQIVTHKGCIRDLYYADGTKVPRVYHGHPLETFVEVDTGSRTCASCGSNKSGEFIGCESCRVFYHRTCFQVPEILPFPTHHPDHTLFLFLGTDNQQQCQSCSISSDDEMYYLCNLCEFFVHARCALEVLAYCEEGMSAEIKLSWHKHPLLLCHRIKSVCNYCEDESIGPMYVCQEKDCGFLLHKRCTEIESTITHPHHPHHPLNLWEGDGYVSLCTACLGVIKGLSFFCKRCSIKFHVKCAARFPTHKHYLHEHELQHFERIQYMECGRCGTTSDSPFFRCVACNFNLHEECMELPQVMRNDKIHWHPLTLYETFLEDDTGEYYCEHCEKTRDPRLGVYVCRYCKISMPRIYHIHCVLPELGKLYEKGSSYAFKKLNERITEKEEEVRAIEERLKKETQNLEEATRELDELMKQRTSVHD